MKGQRKTREMCSRGGCREIGVIQKSSGRWCPEHWTARQRKGRLWRQRDALRAFWAATGVNERCTYCGGPFEDVDHFVPRNLGGSDDFSNLVPACAACNAAKAASAPDPQSLVDWLLARCPA